MSLDVSIARILLALSVVLFALHFLHLNADFPNNSPWRDWSKYTDEGWYGDAAIRHYATGHWYWKGDFNPAVALPVWPALEWVLFRFAGVSAAAARALTVGIFGLTLAGFYTLLRRFTRAPRKGAAPSLAPSLCIFLLAASPFFFVFERLAILEPLMIALTVAALLAASSLHPWKRDSSRSLFSRAAPSLALGLLLPAMVLTKTTAIFLFPAVAYMVWARAGYRGRRALAFAAAPALIGALLWLAYFLLFVRPHYLEDYRYLFSANGYTGILLDPFETVVLHTFAYGAWMGARLYVAFFAVLVLTLFWSPRLLRNPLLPALLLWIVGYVFFLAYHNNLQPRYYLVVAAPVTAVVALGIDGLREAVAPRRALLATLAALAAVMFIAAPALAYELWIAFHPTYEFRNAAQAIARIVRADKGHSPLILSISGSDLTLMTGLPSIDDDFGTMDLGERARFYKPGWYAAWNELDDDKMDALTPGFHVTRVAAFPALDDQDRNLLILYRLDQQQQPAQPPPPHPRRRVPKPLVTRLGQQPTAAQLQH